MNPKPEPLTLILLCSLLCFSSATEQDIACLKSIKSTLQDPQGFLSSWIFTDQTEGFICRFIGIECWHPNENRVLNLQLADLGLKGEFPLGLANCTSMTGLDLSNNNLYGNLPTNFSKTVPFLTSLDLSRNGFTGRIPESVGNLSYLNSVKLDYNRFTGRIPDGLGLLGRLKSFSVANNRLSGKIPAFAHTVVTPENFANNSGLCGKPLAPCKTRP